MVKHIVGLGFDGGHNRLVAHVYFLDTFNFHKLQGWKIFKSCGHVCYLLQTSAECVKLSEDVIFTVGMTQQSWVKKQNIVSVWFQGDFKAVVYRPQFKFLFKRVLLYIFFHLVEALLVLLVQLNTFFHPLEQFLSKWEYRSMYFIYIQT